MCDFWLPTPTYITTCMYTVEYTYAKENIFHNIAVVYETTVTCCCRGLRQEDGATGLAPADAAAGERPG